MQLRSYNNKALGQSLYRSLILSALAVTFFIALLSYFLFKENEAVNQSLDNRMKALLSEAVQWHANEAILSHLQDTSEAKDRLQTVAESIMPESKHATSLGETCLVNQLKGDTSWIGNMTRWLMTQDNARNIVSLTLTFEGEGIRQVKTIKQNTIRDGLGVIVYDFVATYPLLDARGHKYSLSIVGVSQLEQEQLHLFYLLLVIVLTFVLVILSIVHLFYRLSLAYRIQAINEQYFWGLVHDLKTPLSYTKMLLDKIHIDLSKRDNGTQHLQIIEGSLQIDHITEKVDELLSLPRLSRLSANDYVKCYPADLLFEIEEELKHIYAHLDFNFSFIVDETLNLKLPHKHLQMVLRILMDNAVCYAREYGTLEVELKLLKKELGVMVRDHGKGLTIKGKKLIIRPTTIVPTQGNGIGLITVSRILEALDRSLGYEKLPIGCQFSFTIPIQYE